MGELNKKSPISETLITIYCSSETAENYRKMIDTMIEHQINIDRLKKLNDIFGELE